MTIQNAKDLDDKNQRPLELFLWPRNMLNICYPDSKIGE